MNVFFDSSAIVKLLLGERDSRLVDMLWSRAARRIVSRMTYPEVRAALAAALRSERITATAHEDVCNSFDETFAAADVIDVDDLLAIEAADLADSYALRGYDAVHLASALSVDAPRVVVATWDRDLSAAASACGCAVVPAKP